LKCQGNHNLYNSCCCTVQCTSAQSEYRPQPSFEVLPLCTHSTNSLCFLCLDIIVHSSSCHSPRTNCQQCTNCQCTTLGYYHTLSLTQHVTRKSTILSETADFSVDAFCKTQVATELNTASGHTMPQLLHLYNIRCNVFRIGIVMASKNEREQTDA